VGEAIAIFWNANTNPMANPPITPAEFASLKDGQHGVSYLYQPGSTNLVLR